MTSGQNGKVRHFSNGTQIGVHANNVAPVKLWVFSGASRHFPGGIFSRRSLAEEWIASHKLTGTLTLYPLDVGAYEWAIGQDWFRPSKPHESEPLFIGGFSAAQQDHRHYQDGELVS